MLCELYTADATEVINRNKRLRLLYACIWQNLIGTWIGIYRLFVNNRLFDSVQPMRPTTLELNTVQEYKVFTKQETITPEMATTEIRTREMHHCMQQDRKLQNLEQD